MAAAAAIQARITRFVFDDDSTQPKSVDCCPRPGARLCPCINKQKGIGYVAAASSGLLLWQVFPAEKAEDRKDEFVFCLRLGGVGHLFEMRPMLAYRFGEGCYFGGGEVTVLVHLADAVVEEIPGKKFAADHNVPARLSVEYRMRLVDD